MEQSFFQTDSQCSSVQLSGCKNALHPLLCPKGDLPWTPKPLSCLISANFSVSVSDALQAFLFLSCPHLSYWKNVPQSPSSCSLLQEPFSSCRRLHWTVWAGSIPHSHGLIATGHPQSLWGKTIFFTTAHKTWKWSLINWNGHCPSQGFKSNKQNSDHLSLFVIQKKLWQTYCFLERQCQSGFRCFWRFTEFTQG